MQRPQVCSNGTFLNPKSILPLKIILGASFVTSLANIEGEESFEATLLGEAETVAQTRISDDELILIKVVVLTTLDF